MTMKTNELLDNIDHRTWPFPSDRRWAMFMRWEMLAFLHWPVDPGILRPMIPDALELDTFNGFAWVGVVPFLMRDTRPRYLPAIPGLSTFPELNVRTYVSTPAPDGASDAQRKPGVWFFSLDAANRVAVETARRTFFLPYLHASMTCDHQRDGSVRFTSVRRDSRALDARFEAVYRPTAPPSLARAGSLDWFLTERYCLYAQHARRGHILRGDIHHMPWSLQPCEIDIDDNDVAAAAGITVDGATNPPVVHYAASLDVVAWTEVTNVASAMLEEK